MNNGPLIDALEDNIKSQDKTIQALEQKNDEYKEALQLIANLRLAGKPLRYIDDIKLIANEALIEVEIEEIMVADRTVKG